MRKEDKRISQSVSQPFNLRTSYAMQHICAWLALTFLLCHQLIFSSSVDGLLTFRGRSLVGFYVWEACHVSYFLLLFLLDLRDSDHCLGGPMKGHSCITYIGKGRRRHGMVMGKNGDHDDDEEETHSHSTFRGTPPKRIDPAPILF